MIIRKQINSIESAYNDLLAKHERVLEMLRIAESAIKNELEAMGDCCCGAEEPLGEGYTGVACFLHEGLEQIERLKNG